MVTKNELRKREAKLEHLLTPLPLPRRPSLLPSRSALAPVYRWATPSQHLHTAVTLVEWRLGLRRTPRLALA